MRAALLLVLLALPAGAAPRNLGEPQTLRQDRRNRFGGTDLSLLRLSGPFFAGTTLTNPVADSTTAWCMSVSLIATSSAWSSYPAEGMIVLGGPFPSANSAYLYTSAQTSVFRAYNSGGGLIAEITGATTASPVNKFSLCRAPEGFTVRVNGVLAAGPLLTPSFTLATTVRLADLGPGQFPMTSALTNFCVSGPQPGAGGTTAAQLVKAACGEFTSIATNNAVALGDSITIRNTPTHYPYRLMQNLGFTNPRWFVTAGGVSGDTLAMMKTRFDSTYKAAGYTRTVLLGGVNDIRNIGADGPTALASWTALADDILSDGQRLVAVTILPWRGDASWTSAKQTYTEYLNAGILAYCAAHASTVTCVDAYSDFNDGTGAMKAIYDGDHLHPNQAGSDRIATLVAAGWPP